MLGRHPLLVMLVATDHKVSSDAAITKASHVFVENLALLNSSSLAGSRTQKNYLTSDRSFILFNRLRIRDNIDSNEPPPPVERCVKLDSKSHS